MGAIRRWWLCIGDAFQRDDRTARSRPVRWVVALLPLTSGLLLLLWPSSAAAFAYDAVIHAIAIGFVLSMIFAHAPIILPAVTGLRVRFSSAAYGPLGLLHLSVLIRVIGDALESGDIRAVSGVLSVAAFALYGATLVAVSWRHASPTRPKR